MSDKWFRKLESFVPRWVMEDKNPEKEKVVAIFKSAAAALQLAEDSGVEALNDTYISSAAEPYVARHGEERSAERLENEPLSSYRERIKQIVNNSNLPALRNLITPLLLKGTPTFIEHYAATGGFLNRESYLNRNIIDFQVLYNAFTIIIEEQIPDAELFASRGNFLNREEFIGSDVSIDSVFTNIIKTVNSNKAYGTVYRLIERTS